MYILPVEYPTEQPKENMNQLRLTALATAFFVSSFAHAQDGVTAYPQGAPAPATVPAPAPTVAPAPARPAVPAPALPAVENSVVKIFATIRRPDPYKPWTKA